MFRLVSDPRHRLQTVYFTYVKASPLGADIAINGMTIGGTGPTAKGRMSIPGIPPGPISLFPVASSVPDPLEHRAQVPPLPTR